MDKTDLSLILSTAGVAISLGLGVIAAALVAAFLAGLLTGKELGGP
jgi:hypothetical protein